MRRYDFIADLVEFASKSGSKELLVRVLRLSDPEKRVYFALTRNDGATSKELADIVNYSRPHTLIILNHLVGLGLAKRFKDGKKVRFKVKF